MADLRCVGVSIVTIGQYLRPSRGHFPGSRYWAPERARDDLGHSLAEGAAVVDSASAGRPRWTWIVLSTKR